MPLNSRSYFNNKHCVFTMKPSNPLVLLLGPQAGTQQRHIPPEVIADSTQV